jgi:hypothetical protein
MPGPCMLITLVTIDVVAMPGAVLLCHTVPALVCIESLFVDWRFNAMLPLILLLCVEQEGI